MHRSAENENPNKNDDEEFQSDELQGVPDWLQEFKHGLVDERFQNIDTLPVLLMNHLWSREQKWYRVTQHFNSFTETATQMKAKTIRDAKAKASRWTWWKRISLPKTATTVPCPSQTLSRIGALTCNSQMEQKS